MIPIKDEEYKQLYQECFTRFLTRRRPSRDPILFGCRISGFLYILFCLLWDKDRTVRDPAWEGFRINRTLFFKKIETIIHLEEMTIEDPTLNTIFVDNQVAGDYAVLSAEGPSHVDTIEEEAAGMRIPVKMQHFETLFERFPFAIFGIVFREYMPGFIIHYFVVRKEGPHYIMISSYGSNYAEIKQYETPLDVAEFTEYVRQLSTIERNMEFVSYFMKKYFLDKSKGVPDKIDEVNEEGYHVHKKTHLSHFDDEGNFSHVKNTDISIDAELASFYGNATGRFHLFDVVCFSSAVDMLSRLITDGGMRQRRTRKGKRTHYVRSRRMSRRTLHKK